MILSQLYFDNLLNLVDGAGKGFFVDSDALTFLNPGYHIFKHKKVFFLLRCVTNKLKSLYSISLIGNPTKVDKLIGIFGL
jgi:hypothetical protein